MVLPIVAYGSEILRKKTADITPDYEGLQQFIADMWETMYASNGVGLAAPQVNKNLRMFVVDSEQIFRNLEEDEPTYPDDPGIKQVFINAKIEETDGELWAYNEGCLSIPKIREDISRPEAVTLSYMDERFEKHTRTFNGVTARIILHEYDHTEGKLFIDYLSPLKRRLLKRKLDDISRGAIKTDYRMVFNK